MRINKINFISITIKTKNRIGETWKNVNVELIHIDDYFYHKPKTIQGMTNIEGIVKFHVVPEGTYLIKTTTNRVYSEEVHKLTNNQILEIKLPSIFGLFSKKKEVNDDTKDEIYEEERTDHDICFDCKEKYKSYTDKFCCAYCKKYFCSNHRLPENHNCWGEPKAPSGGFHEIHTAGGKVIATGK